MYKYFILILLLCLHGNSTAEEKPTKVYEQELEAFKKMPDYQAMFNDNVDGSIKSLQKDIRNATQLSMGQRMLRYALLQFNCIAITAAQMPMLYSYIGTLCKEHGIVTPTVFITLDKEGFLNAAAYKILKSTGGIIIGQELFYKTTDQELEAILAHEIGHIKYNHVNKKILIAMGAAISSSLAVDVMFPAESYAKEAFKKFLIVSAPTIATFIINKRFEKQADEFAYREAQRGRGLIEFFEHLETMEQENDNAYPQTYSLLQQNAPHLSWSDYITLRARYSLASLGHAMIKAYKWLYHHTPYGDHPHPRARIAEAKAYLKHTQQNAVAALDANLNTPVVL